MLDSTVSRINFFLNSSHHVLKFFFCVLVLSSCSEKKTRAKAVGGMAHSGRATPASGEESSDHYELGPEGEEMDSAEDADAIQDTDATDNQALGSGLAHCVARWFKEREDPVPVVFASNLI